MTHSTVRVRECNGDMMLACAQAEALANDSGRILVIFATLCENGGSEGDWTRLAIN